MEFYGYHASINLGIKEALENLKKDKCNIMQIFVSNPRSSKIVDYKNKYKSSTIEEIISYKNKYKLKIVIHLPYTINLSNSAINLNLVYSQLIFSHTINSIGCVIHVGKHKNLSEYEGEENMFKNLKKIVNFIKENSLNTFIILETSAGEGTELLQSLTLLGNFYNRFSSEEKKYLKLCIDTCHIYAAGHDIRTKEMVKNLFNKINKEIGISNIALLHLNDCKGKFNCHVDRHDNLGYGTIGLKGIKQFIRYALYYHIPIVLETPFNEIRSYEIKLIKKEEKKLFKNS